LAIKGDVTPSFLMSKDRRNREGKQNQNQEKSPYDFVYNADCMKAFLFF
jgi:hypothetical protein